MNFNLSNGWGIVRTIVDVCLKQDDGTYLLIKDRKSLCYDMLMCSKQADHPSLCTPRRPRRGLAYSSIDFNIIRPTFRHDLNLVACNTIVATVQTLAIDMTDVNPVTMLACLASRLTTSA